MKSLSKLLEEHLLESDRHVTRCQRSRKCDEEAITSVLEIVAAKALGKLSNKTIMPDKSLTHESTILLP
ncbi:hypothetical protein [Armatimonas sp.]|uniref:hypothetical protein n=1 Tax=Armatimonas sp. TaxID=1872638 RepID=UPI003750C2BC